VKLLEFQMSGTAHSPGYKASKNAITEGDDLTFERDPHNQYDTNAIKVLWKGTQIGWVPKKLGEAKAILDRLLECEEFNISAEVESHEADNPTDMQLTVVVNLYAFEE
jgi:hypothetical protein